MDLRFHLFTENEHSIYNNFISKQPEGSFLQSWEWGQWRERFGEPTIRFGIYDAGRLVAAGQGEMVVVPVVGQRYMYIAHGPIIDHSLPSELTDRVTNFIFQEIRKAFLDLLFVRVEPIDASVNSYLISVGKKSINIQAAKTLWIELSKKRDELLSEMHHKTRYNIRVAEKHSVVVTVDTDLDLTKNSIQQCIDLIVATQVRQAYRGHDRNYYTQLLEHFKTSHGDLKVSVYSARFEGQLLTAGIMVDFSDKRMYLFGGSSHEHRNVMAPYMMHWQAICDAQEKGLHWYDFGGSETAGGNEDVGFSRFKAGFGGNVITYGGAYDIITHWFKYFIYNLLRMIRRQIAQ